MGGPKAQRLTPGLSRAAGQKAESKRLGGLRGQCSEETDVSDLWTLVGEGWLKS